MKNWQDEIIFMIRLPILFIFLVEYVLIELEYRGATERLARAEKC